MPSLCVIVPFMGYLKQFQLLKLTWHPRHRHLQGWNAATQRRCFYGMEPFSSGTQLTPAMCHLHSSLVVENWRTPKNSYVFLSFCSFLRFLEVWFQTCCQWPPTNVKIMLVHVTVFLCPHLESLKLKLKRAESSELDLVFISCLKLF